MDLVPWVLLLILTWQLGSSALLQITLNFFRKKMTFNPMDSTEFLLHIFAYLKWNLIVTKEFQLIGSSRELSNVMSLLGFGIVLLLFYKKRELFPHPAGYISKPYLFSYLLKIEAMELKFAFFWIFAKGHCKKKMEYCISTSNRDFP